MVRKSILVAVLAGLAYVIACGVVHWENFSSIRAAASETEQGGNGRDSRGRSNAESLAALDAHGFNGVEEITRPELVKLMTRFRPLTQEEKANLDRGCPGFVCVYQGLGLKRWPESAAGTVAFLSHQDALNRHCANAQKNFVFVKQGCWLTGKPPTPDPVTGEVPVNSVTRARPGLYTFNYAVYFPSTATYAWMNHRNYGFPVNLMKPQRAFLSPFPPPLDDDTRPAQIYCSTCR